jgi:hypothetical protein
VPAHDVGTILRSRLTDWDHQQGDLLHPEPVQQADVVVLVGGFDGTFRAANWARIAQEAAAAVRRPRRRLRADLPAELNEFAAKYGARVDRLEYEAAQHLKPKTGASTRPTSSRAPRRSRGRAGCS